MRRHLRAHFVALALATLGTTLGACGDDPVRVSVAPSLVFPQGLLDGVDKLVLTVLDTSTGAACDPAAGAVSGADAAPKLLTKELAKSPCSPGVKFCGDLDLEKTSADRIFSAQASASDGTVLAVGCATAKVDQDALPLSIKMVRYVPPAQCGNGVIEATEQCEGAGFGCDDQCHSTEVLVSSGESSGKTTTGGPGDKTDPFFLWPAQNGDGGRFLAFYTDKTPGLTDVAMTAMTAQLTPLGTPPVFTCQGSAARGKPCSILLPNGPTFPPDPAPKSQGVPSAATLNGKYYVVFQDDDSSNGQDIHLRSMDGAFVAEQGVGAAVGVNGEPSGQGDPGIQSAPQISAPASGDKLLVAWQDDASGGKIVARTITPAGVRGTQREISTGTGNSRVALAPTPDGWVVVWESGGDIKLRRVNGDGLPTGAEQTVNEATTGVQERPRVASLGDGRFCVVWADKGNGADIVAQRFNASGGKIAGDQSKPVNDVNASGDQTAPSVAGLTAAGGAFAVAWHDAGSGHVRARFLGGSAGFLFNNVTGQASEFQASLADGRTRANPVVVAGGSGPFVAIGWEDRSTGGAGIVVRRFPAPK